jgi:hypothetical protein
MHEPKKVNPILAPKSTMQQNHSLFPPCLTDILHNLFLLNHTLSPPPTFILSMTDYDHPKCQVGFHLPLEWNVWQLQPCCSFEILHCQCCNHLPLETEQAIKFLNCHANFTSSDRKSSEMTLTQKVGFGENLCTPMDLVSQQSTTVSLSHSMCPTYNPLQSRDTNNSLEIHIPQADRSVVSELTKFTACTHPATRCSQKERVLFICEQTWFK